MTERASILSGLTDLRIELADARLALDRCPANERASIANRIVQIQSEVVRGEDLLARIPLVLPPPPTVGEASPGVSNPAARPAASLLSTWKVEP